MSEQHLLKHSDTFSEWMDKINNLIEGRVSELEEKVSILESLVESLLEEQS